MRGALVLLALVAAPMLTAAAQGPDKSSEPSQPGLVENSEQCATADANRSPQSWTRNGQRSGQARGQEQNGDHRRGCSPVAPQPDAPPPPPPPPPPSGGTSWITGGVYEDTGNSPGLPGWTIELSGTMTATTLTDASGNYRFSNLPAGTYTVCQRVQAGWTQTYPSSGPACSVAFGHGFDLGDGKGAVYNTFLNVRR